MDNIKKTRASLLQSHPLVFHTDRPQSNQEALRVDPENLITLKEDDDDDSPTYGDPSLLISKDILVGKSR